MHAEVGGCEALLYAPGMRVGRNELCPCGSGKKYKKCCLESEPVRYTVEDRAAARQLLDEYVMEHLGEEDDESLDELWGPLEDLDDDLEPCFSALSEQVGDDWFEFDRPLADGARVVDRFLDASGARLTRGQQQHLAVMKTSTMRLYEIEDVRPGESLSLRDVVEDTRVTVQERSGSRGLHRFDWIAARVVTAGASGKPELEGVLQFPGALQGPFREHLVKQKARFLEEHPGATIDDFYRTMPPVFHEAWARAILDPQLPQLTTTDGEALVLTTVRFTVQDAGALASALDGADGLERQGEQPSWHWVGPNSKGAPTIFGFLALRGETLELETNSVERGQKGRALVEAATGAAVRHRATSHEDAQQAMKRELRRHRKEGSGVAAEAATGIPPELQEALVLDHLAEHYRAWLDIPVPGLDDATPREAAKSPALKPRLIELSHELDGMYQRALADGDPAFDPSWLWQELGILEAPPHPPPLAFERVEQLVPGSGEVCRAVAEALRRQPSFAERAVTDDEVRLNLELQRFLRELPAQEGRPPLGPYLHRMVDVEGAVVAVSLLVLGDEDGRHLEVVPLHRALRPLGQEPLGHGEDVAVGEDESEGGEGDAELRGPQVDVRLGPPGLGGARRSTRRRSAGAGAPRLGRALGHGGRAGPHEPAPRTPSGGGQRRPLRHQRGRRRRDAPGARVPSPGQAESRRATGDAELGRRLLPAGGHRNLPGAPPERAPATFQGPVGPPPLHGPGPLEARPGGRG